MSWFLEFPGSGYEEVRSKTDESALDSRERDEVRENLSNLGYL